ncbi:UvrD-helicase domain-containing protein [Neobacillus niacini]|uniref:UvrD-helicase domain-containing protein n=1 Tax=Neobacillus niacini TaxID=86668 RepID=UPI003000B3C5
MNDKYSVLWFCPDFNSNKIKQLKSYIYSGTKVFFLSYNDLEDIRSDVFLTEAHSKGLLYSYMVKYSESWNEEQFLFNGEQDHDLLSFLDENSSFNKEQYMLEHSSLNHHLIVKAGAGTGKTTTMINRMMYLKYMDPELNMESVVMITFTNDAAIHMRAKLLEKLKNYYEVTKDPVYLEWMEEIGEMFIGTIHAFARQFLSFEGQKLGFDPSMKVRSYLYDRKKLVERFIDEFSVLEPNLYKGFKHVQHYKLVKAIMDILDRINNKSVSYDDILLRMDFGIDQKNFHQMVQFLVHQVVKELDIRKRQDEAVEISDLISQLTKLRELSIDELILKIRYLFVDEFQDTDEAQVSFVSWLAAKYQSQLFAVGDIKQSIYRFRGADYTAFNQLKSQLELANHPFDEFSLKKNYRSEAKLIKQFNRLFDKWSDRIKMFQFDETDKLIPVLEDTTHEGLVTLSMNDWNLQHLLKRLYHQDVAVLVRSNRHVRKSVELIESLGFFCEATVSGSFYRSLPVREFYLLLRRFTHPFVPKDQYLFHCSSYGANELSVAQVMQQFSPERLTILDQVGEFENDAIQFNNATAAIANLQQYIEQVKPHEVFCKRYYQDLRLRFPNVDEEMQQVEAQAKMKEYKVNLDRLLFLLKKQFGDFKASLYDYEKFLSIKMATDSTENEWKLQKEASHRIKVMTVHKAKGLEFDYVLMPETSSTFVKNGKTQVLLLQEEGYWKLGYYVNWNDQVVENSHYKQNIVDENIELIAEESRLLYVALTRAKKGVFVNSSPSTSRQSFQCWSDLLESGELLHV